MREEEQALLGALMIHPDSVLETDVEPADFSTADGQRVYRCMVQLAQGGVKIDPMTVGEECEDKKLAGRLAMAGGAADNIPHYAAKVKKSAKLRKLSNSAQAVINSSQEPDADPDVLADVLLSDLSETASSRDVWEMPELIDAVMHDADAAQVAYEQGTAVGIQTGWSAVDRILHGLHPGRLYIFGARPKMGKTSMALSLQHNAARAGNNIGFASAEMGAKECGNRWIASAAGVEATAIQRGKLTNDDSSKLAQAATRLRELPIHILDKAAVTPSRIRRQCLAWQRRYGLDMLVIDYLQRLTPDDKGERRDLVVGQMVRAFKTVARDLNIPVVLLAQLSRELERRDDKRPVPSDLRESGEIEQEADVIAFLYRDWVYNEHADPEEVEILVRANRHGPPGKATLRFQPDFQRWLDRDMASYEG